MVTRPLPAAAPARTVPFAARLAQHGTKAALITRDEQLTYRELADRVGALTGLLGQARRLVLLGAANTVESVVAYLATLSAGHPVLLAADDDAVIEPLVTAYDPDVVIRAAGGRCEPEEWRERSAHALHPDLALLLSTSGSTGSPKLVRLSHENLQANAESIATYLMICDGDRAATTLPMHYCYGLSVLNSHLLRGASLLLADHSVADPRFWELFRTHRATTFAGVPYTFDLLERVGFERMHLPHLRYITQAGGRLAPQRVRHYHDLGRRHGWSFVVMYGQTEATARMAYLPPDRTATHPESIGVPIPGGSFRLEPLPEWPDPAVGELVYSGPNVMLGYARSPSELALGRSTHELRTGDIARRNDAGLYQLVGRRSRFLKLFGLRLDLEQVESVLRRRGIEARCVGGDDSLVAGVTGGADLDRVRSVVAQAFGLPPHAVLACAVPVLPRLANGKPDDPALRALARGAAHARRRSTAPAGPRHRPGRADVRALFAETLERPDVTDDSTFVSLGGDSLSYVETSIRLEEALGHLPPDWHTTPIRDLRPAPRAPLRRRALETSVALRAIAIALIVGSHAGLYSILGGAHVLLGVAGFNFARFHLTPAGRGDRTRSIGASIARVALPSMVWIALAGAVTGHYALREVLLLDEVFGPPGRPNEFWFIEVLVYLLAVTLALLALPGVDRLERRAPFAFPFGLMALALGFRYDLVPGVELPGPLAVSWLFALGWAVAKADTTVARLCATLAVVTTVPGFHGHAQREAVIVAGLLLLTWVPTIPSTRLLSRLLGTLAASSLYIYLTHWQVYQRLDGAPLLGVAASLVVGIAYAALARHATALLSGLRSHDLGRRLKDSQQSVPLALSALLVRPRGIKLTRAIGARGGPKDR